ncbi:alpha/beta fold hydrolase [Microterricola viridarii]|nr:alpha/beta hydrolase [Microterricola viridarii]
MAAPLLLLHAWGETGRSFDRLLPLLPPGVGARAVDQRWDDSAAPRTLASLAAEVLAFMDAAGLPRAVLLGSSSGGYVAQEVAVAAPERVAGLVLVGTPRSLRGRPAFAGDVERLTDPVGAGWVRRSLDWFPRVQAVPPWYIDDRVSDGARIPARVWRETLTALCTAEPPTESGGVPLGAGIAAPPRNSARPAWQHPGAPGAA